MNRGQIREKIVNEVQDEDIEDEIIDSFIQEADYAIQTWRPQEQGLGQTFDFWDYLRESKSYTMTAGQVKFKLPDNYRSFVEFTIEGDTTQYKLIDFSLRNNYTGHVCWILGGYLYIQTNSLDAGTIATLVFVHMSDDFIADADEPEVEAIYHGALISFGKAKYYNRDGDKQLEDQNMADFEKWMVRKKNDQEIARMQTNPTEVSLSQSSVA